MKRKRFVLSGYFGFKNFGDELILSVLVNKLKELNGSITVISSNPVYTKSKFKHIRSVGTFKFLDIIAAIAKSDYLISGGGSLLQDVTSFKSLIYYLMIIFIALVLRKKVIIFAQGIGPINNSLGKLLTKVLLKQCSYVSVRDEKSLKLMHDWGIRADLVCDPAFSINVCDAVKTDSVAVQLRNFKTMNDDFIDRLAHKISVEFPGKSVEIYSLQDDIDLDVCSRFEKSLRLLNPEMVINKYYNLNEEDVINGIAKSKYLVAMRFHAIIIGLLSGTATLAVDYDIKVQKLAAEYNLPVVTLTKEFGHEFEQLKDLNIEKINRLNTLKTFEWTGFLDSIYSPRG